MKRILKLNIVSSFLLVLIAISSFISISYLKVKEIDKYYLSIFFIIILLILAFEVIVIILKLYKYLFDKIYSSPSENSDKLITLVSKDINLFDNSCSIDEKVNIIIEHTFFHRILKKQTINRILFFFSFSARYILAFTLTNFSLVCLYFISDPNIQIIKDIQITHDNFFEIIEKLFYFSLVTSTTIGFGDIVPLHFIIRLVIDMQIVSSVIIIIIGGNLLIGSLMENTPLAWNSRKEYLKIHIQKGMAQKINLGS